jgi:hypothetical protein
MCLLVVVREKGRERERGRKRERKKCKESGRVEIGDRRIKAEQLPSLLECERVFMILSISISSHECANIAECVPVRTCLSVCVCVACVRISTYNCMCEGVCLCVRACVCVVQAYMAQQLSGSIELACCVYLHTELSSIRSCLISLTRRSMECKKDRGQDGNKGRLQ